METVLNCQQAEQKTDRLKITFPIEFTYRIIGLQSVDLVESLQRCLEKEKKRGKILLKRKSRKGTYCAIQVTLRLNARAELTHYYETFAALPGVCHIL